MRKAVCEMEGRAAQRSVSARACQPGTYRSSGFPMSGRHVYKAVAGQRTGARDSGQLTDCSKPFLIKLTPNEFSLLAYVYERGPTFLVPVRSQVSLSSAPPP